MSLRLIYGRAGCGKTSFCFEDIREKICKNDKIYIITPEQFSFTAEKTLLEKLNTNSVISAEVLTFNRMAYRLFNEVSGTGKDNLSKTGRNMLLYSILTKNKGSLKFLGNTDENIDTVSNILTDFKKHAISQAMLESTIANIEDKYLNTKLQDINLIYKKYEEYIQNNFVDEDDILTIIADKLIKSNMFANSIVYLDEFVRLYTTRV
jgi:ATP-dependent helicase/nuclease subunit B